MATAARRCSLPASRPLPRARRASAAVRRRGAARALFGGGGPSAKELQARVASLEKELEEKSKLLKSLAATSNKAEEERDAAEARVKRLEPRLRDAEKEIFALERQLEERDAKFEAFEVVAKRQIKMLEGMLEEAKQQ